MDLGITLLTVTLLLVVVLIARAVPFLVLAVLVERGRSAEGVMRESGEPFRLVAYAGKCSPMSGMLPPA